MNRTILLNLASSGVEATLNAAKHLSGLDLPDDTVHSVHWKGLVGQVFSLPEALDTLYGDSRLPPIIDLVVRGVLTRETLIVWIPSGHDWVSSLEDTWNEGYGPFKPMGLMLPCGVKIDNLTLDTMKELGEDWLRTPNN